MPYQTSLRTVLAACSILSIAPQALAHMEMSWPYPIRSKYDPANSYTIIDYSMTSPLLADGSNFPCKGYQNDRPIVDKVTYTAGSTYNMTLAGSAVHGGGSCQLSLSYDNGATFRVIKSMIGGCPLTTTYDFTIPSYAPEGNALFAWTWQNLQGNREFYMNCAEVDITGSGIAARAADSFDELPFIWKANLPGINDCATAENVNVVYPNPGPDVIYGGGLSSSSSATSGTCDAAKPFGQAYEYLSDSVNPTTENLGTTAASTAAATSSSRSVTTTLVTSSKAATSSTQAAASTSSTTKVASSSTTSKVVSSSTTSKAASTSTTSKAASTSTTSKAVSSSTTTKAVSTSTATKAVSSSSKAASSSSTAKVVSTGSISKAASSSSVSKAASSSSNSKAASSSSISKAASSSSASKAASTSSTSKAASTSKASSAGTAITLSTVRAGKTETLTGSTCPTDVTLTVYSSAASTASTGTTSGFVTSKVSASLTGSSVSTVVGFSTGGGSSTVVVVSAASSSTAKAASTSTKKASTSSATTSSAGAEVTEGYATGDLATYLPCVPGTYICTSNTTWVTCDQTMYSDGSTAWVYEESRTVAAGMACVPNLSPYSSATQQYAQQADAPAGYYRDDRYAAAQTYGACSTDGALQCTNGGSEFMICDHGGWVMMGSVAAGTTCTNGAIVASS